MEIISWMFGGILTLLGSVHYCLSISKWLEDRRCPQINFEGSGVLYRHFAMKHCENCGVFNVQGRLTAKYKPVTVVDTKLSFYMDEKDLHGFLFCGDGFPPKMDFHRYDEDGKPVYFEHDPELTIMLTPDSSVDIKQQFEMNGNFAIEYGAEFFESKFATGPHFTMCYISFKYRYKGELYWTEEFVIPVHSYKNMVYDKPKPYYIDEHGKPLGEIIRFTTYCDIETA